MANKLLYFIIASVILIISNLICLFKNPIYSVLFLLILILLVAFLLLIFNVYYLATTLIIIYAGAVIVLFIFLIFTLRKDFKISFDYKIYLPNNLTLFFFFFTNLVFSIIIDNFFFSYPQPKMKDPIELFIYLFKYDSRDINIFSENLYSVYYIFLGTTVCTMLLALIMAIMIAKKTDNTRSDVVADNTVKKKLIKAKILNDSKK